MMKTWNMEVADPVGRARAVSVDTDDGRVTVTTPPGEGFSMDPDQADQLAAAILAASSRARQASGHHRKLARGLDGPASR